MREQTADFSSSEFSTRDMEEQTERSSGAKRNALLVAGASAVAFGLWRRGRIGWPAAIGGSVLVARGAVQQLPRESSCEVSETIDRSPAEISSYLREVKNWPVFMKRIRDESSGDFSVDQPNVIRWREGTRQWRANITGSSELSLHWRAESDGQVRECSVELRPAPGDRGTEVHWHVRSKTPMTVLADLFRMGVGGSEQQIALESLRALKQLLEAGEVATTDGQPHGDRGAKGKVERRLFRESIDEKPARRQPGFVGRERVAS